MGFASSSTSRPPSSTSLPPTSPTLFATDDGGLWVGYRFGGLSLIKDDTIQSWVPGDSLPHGSMVTIVEDSSGTTWVGTTSGLARLVDGTLAPRWCR